MIQLSPGPGFEQALRLIALFQNHWRPLRLVGVSTVHRPEVEQGGRLAGLSVYVAAPLEIGALEEAMCSDEVVPRAPPRVCGKRDPPASFPLHRMHRP